ncbi:hypothetical protein [Haladaptatus sp. NG-WS-4]
MTVSPGDVIVGDTAGVAVVPQADAETVAEAVAAKPETEADLRERVADGEYLFDALDLDDRHRELDIEER